MSRHLQKKTVGFQHENHPKPVTRRDFIAQGLMGSVGVVMAPTLLGMLARSAYAAECESVVDGGVMPAVLIFDHAGGAGLLQQTLPFAKGDQLLAAEGYRALGLPSGQDPISASMAAVLDESWGIRFQKNLAFVTQLNAIGLPAAKALTNSFTVLGQLNDDTSDNPINPAAALALLGLRGDSDRKIVPVIGTSASISGGNSAPLVSSPLYRAVRISSATSAESLISTGQLQVRLNNDRGLAARVVAAVRNMTAGHVGRFSEQDLPKQVKDLVDCGYVKAAQLAGPASGSDVPSLNPSQNPIMTSVFDFNNAEEQRAATLTWLLAHGFSGVATHVLGGRDYHDGTRVTGEQRDGEAGRLTAKVINAFHRLVTEGGARPRPLMIVHISDGSISTNQTADNNAGGFFAWTSDRGSAGAGYVIAYDPTKRPVVDRKQLGFANAANGGVDRSTGTFTGNPNAFAEVLLSNWLSLAGRSPGDLQNVMRPAMSVSELSQVAILKRG